MKTTSCYESIALFQALTLASLNKETIVQLDASERLQAYTVIQAIKRISGAERHSVQLSEKAQIFLEKLHDKQKTGKEPKSSLSKLSHRILNFIGMRDSSSKILNDIAKSISFLPSDDSFKKKFQRAHQERIILLDSLIKKLNSSIADKEYHLSNLDRIHDFSPKQQEQILRNIKETIDTADKELPQLYSTLAKLKKEKQRIASIKITGCKPSPYENTIRGLRIIFKILLTQ